MVRVERQMQQVKPMAKTERERLTVKRVDEHTLRTIKDVQNAVRLKMGMMLKTDVAFNPINFEKSETILEEAQRITHGARQQDYQLPEANFKQIANIATAILGEEITPRVAAIILISVKLSREAYKHKRDNLVDLAGYAWCLSRIEGDENNLSREAERQATNPASPANLRANHPRNENEPEMADAATRRANDPAERQEAKP